jgi:hypothetical protein
MYNRVGTNVRRGGMSQYRIYCLDEEGRFSKVKEIEASADTEALAQARALNHPGTCEVWERARVVGTVTGGDLCRSGAGPA